MSRVPCSASVSASAELARLTTSFGYAETAVKSMGGAYMRVNDVTVTQLLRLAHAELPTPVPYDNVTRVITCVEGQRVNCASPYKGSEAT